MTVLLFCSIIIFFFKQKTAYEMRISDWSSDVSSSDLDMTNILVNPRIAPVRIGKKVEAILLPIQPGKLGKGLNRIFERVETLLRSHVHNPAFDIVVGTLRCRTAIHLAHDEERHAQHRGIKLHADPWRNGHTTPRVEASHHLALQSKATAQHHLKIRGLATDDK